MGAWDEGSFDNDLAADWADDLAEGGTPQTVLDAIGAVVTLPAGAYVDSDIGSEAIAAAEVIATAAGRPPESNPYNEDALAWAAQHPGLGHPDYRAAAVNALDRIVGPDSELVDTWIGDDPRQGHPWLAAVTELRARLVG